MEAKKKLPFLIF